MGQVSEKSQVITSWVLAGVGGTVCMLALVSMIRAMYKWRGGGEEGRRRREGGRVIAYLLKCLLPWAPFTRTLNIVLVNCEPDAEGGYVGQVWRTQSFGEILVGSLPGYLLLA